MQGVQPKLPGQEGVPRAKSKNVQGTSGEATSAFSRHVTLHKKIGSGLYSNVHVGSLTIRKKGIPERFAVKISDKWGSKENFDAEVKALSLLKKCPFVVDMFVSYIDKYPHILLELGDIDLNALTNLMIKKSIRFTDGNLNFIIDNLARAAEFMLKTGIYNYDLYEKNVMYFFNQNSLKFIDFNTAEFDVPAQKNTIMRNIGLIVTFCKLREAHKCKKENMYCCDTCKVAARNVDKVIDEVTWESDTFYFLLKRLTKSDSTESLKPSEVYSSLKEKEALPQLTST